MEVTVLARFLLDRCFLRFLAGVDFGVREVRLECLLRLLLRSIQRY
jgi:hypothetical protein